MTFKKPNNPASLAVMISGRGSNLGALIKACTDPEYPATITKVISDRADAGGLELARAAGIEHVAIERAQFTSKVEHEAAILAELDKNRPDLICLAGFMRILSADFVQHYEGKILNIHPSLLPKYPGLNTHARALAAGDRKHGCTVHFVDADLDSGPIVASASLDVQPGDDEDILTQRVLKLEHVLYPQAVLKVLAKARNA